MKGHWEALSSRGIPAGRPGAWPHSLRSWAMALNVKKEILCFRDSGEKEREGGGWPQMRLPDFPLGCPRQSLDAEQYAVAHPVMSRVSVMSPRPWHMG